MLTTSRDCKRDSARNAIPSLGEIEGRMAVLEVVAQAALTHALVEGDDSVDRSLIAEIREAMHDKCGEMKLDRTDETDCTATGSIPRFGSSMAPSTCRKARAWVSPSRRRFSRTPRRSN